MNAAANFPATLDHAGIAARVPHAGRMCLLHALLSWDAEHARCTITGHADPAHPLRSARGLLAPVAIEYASQAMALHAGLSAAAGSPPRAGFLASARNVVAQVARLDTAAGPLTVDVQRLLGDSKQAQYRFALHDAAGALLVDGRTTVVLDGAPNAPVVSTVAP
jgi:predicted hotdog family 3-hydroxylacyl-ACP dehydratase